MKKNGVSDLIFIYKRLTLIGVGEFSVSEVEEIEFSISSFGRVLIPEKQKDVILSLTSSHLVSTSDKEFGDIIDGKGRGIIILLQYVWPLNLLDLSSVC
jgi:hypothetical protein